MYSTCQLLDSCNFCAIDNVDMDKFKSKDDDDNNDNDNKDNKDNKYVQLVIIFLV